MNKKHSVFFGSAVLLIAASIIVVGYAIDGGRESYWLSGISKRFIEMRQNLI
jgi:hypothetical protein